ncbi:hypothetical protein WBG83_07920 [Paenibacillus sp. y28]
MVKKRPSVRKNELIVRAENIRAPNVCSSVVYPYILSFGNW